MIAWVVGGSGTWGGAVVRDLLARGFDVVSLGRTAPEVASDAAANASLRFVALDLEATERELAETVGPTIAAATPDVFVLCSAATGTDRAALIRANYLAPASLVESVARAMAVCGSGHIGVFVGQNARFGLAGAGGFSASQAALWTWCESLQAELGSGGVTLTCVIPPRAASRTQRWLAAQTGRSARLHEPQAHRLVSAVLAGKRTGGRRPILAALAMVVR